MSPSIQKTPSVTTRISRYGPAPSGRPVSRASRRISRRRLDVAVRIDLAGRLRQAHAVDDRGVIEGVGHDQVGLAGDDRDDAGVRGEARLERQDGGRALERGQLGLERLVHRHRAGDRPDRAAPDAELAHRAERRLAQARMVGQAQVVVRRQADQASLVDGHDGTLGAAHDAQRPVEVPLAKLRQLVVEEGQRIGHVVQSMMTLPESPDRAAAKAASNSRNPKRWVMTGGCRGPDWSMTVILYQVSYISRP